MFRHPIVIRVTHWINAVCLLVLLMSGLQIFNAHPALYWGKVSTFDMPLMAMTSTEDDPPKGITSVLGRSFDTTGYLGSSAGSDGEPADRGFPSWLTLPSDQDLRRHTAGSGRQSSRSASREQSSIPLHLIIGSDLPRKPDRHERR